MRNTRKLMRLFESFCEVHKILEIWHKIRTKQYEGINTVIAKFTRMLSRICYCVFWGIDNIKVLAIVKFLKLDPRKVGRFSFFVWFLGLFSSLLHNAMMLRLSYKNEASLKTTVLNNKTPKQVLHMLREFSEDRRKIMLKIVRNVGDLTIAIHQIGATRKFFKININYGVIACAGFLSSQISLYHLYNKIQKNESPQAAFRY